MQVGTYPTRNFATLGPFICVNDRNLFNRGQSKINSNPSCRHEDRTISSSIWIDAWRVVSEDSSLRWPFLLIICTFAFSRGDPFNPRLNKTPITRMKAGFTNFSFVAKDTQMFQHIAKFVHGTTIPLTTRGRARCPIHSYGRHSLGLRFVASPCG